jgi:hypothetical protein
MRQFFKVLCVPAIGLMLAGCTQKIALFNGQNLDGWKPYLQDNSVDAAKVWSVKDNVLRCEGKPTGYLRTVESYSDYTLHLEWRWPEKPANSGVLLNITGEDKVWPQCIEAQLQHLNAGDIVTIQKGSRITINGVLYQPENTIAKVIPKQLSSSEKPAGQWNRYDIVCKNGKIDLSVNGVRQNGGTGALPSAGNIGLQSEGGPIEFRNVYLIPLK